jgi:hypothetical protein
MSPEDMKDFRKSLREWKCKLKKREDQWAVIVPKGLCPAVIAEVAAIVGGYCEQYLIFDEISGKVRADEELVIFVDV